MRGLTAVQSLAAVPLAVRSLVAVSELWKCALLVEPGCVVITIIIIIIVCSPCTQYIQTTYISVRFTSAGNVVLGTGDVCAGTVGIFPSLPANVHVKATHRFT